jgi:hypothetical protein
MKEFPEERLSLKDKFESVLEIFITPYEAHLQYCASVLNSEIRPENYSRHVDAGIELSKKLISIQRESGLRNAREACDYLVQREMEGKPLSDADEALLFYQDMMWGAGDENIGEVFLGWEMKGAYHRYLSKNAESQTGKAMHTIKAIPFTASRSWGGISEYMAMLNSMMP